MKKPYILSLALASLFISCTRDNAVRDNVWVPTYQDKSSSEQIVSLAPQLVVAGGKIYVYNDLLLQVEENKGIHVYILKDSVPHPSSFIQIYGAQELSIKENHLYTNNYRDIVVLNLNDLGAAAEVSRLKNVFELNENILPPTKGYFQCVDTSKGHITGWTKQDNIKAECYY